MGHLRAIKDQGRLASEPREHVLLGLRVDFSPIQPLYPDDTQRLFVILDRYCNLVIRCLCPCLRERTGDTGRDVGTALQISFGLEDALAGQPDGSG